MGILSIFAADKNAWNRAGHLPPKTRTADLAYTRLRYRVSNYYQLHRAVLPTLLGVPSPGPAATATWCCERRGALVIRMPLSRDGEGSDGWRSGVGAQQDDSDGHIVMRHNQNNEGVEISVRGIGRRCHSRSCGAIRGHVAVAALGLRGAAAASGS
jgi:hypothetical protein